MILLDALRKRAAVARAKIKETNLYSHNLSKGEVRERVIADFLRPFLPNCYGIDTGTVFSSEGQTSRQVDIVLYDSVFSVALRLDDRQLLLPCESVYGIVEVKSNMDSTELSRAVENISSLHALPRDPSDRLDFTPISRIDVGDGLTYDDSKQNPYLGIVFALDGLEGGTALTSLLGYQTENRSALPDYIFNLRRGYMISRYKAGQRPGIDCRGMDDYDGYLLKPLGDDVLPVFYLTLNALLNRTRLKQPNIGKLWVDVINSIESRHAMGPWPTG